VTVRAMVAATGSLLLIVVCAVGWRGDRVVVGPEPAVDGAASFQALGCAICHDGPDTTSLVGAGPPLDDAASWAGERRPGMSAEAYLAESIREPAAFFSPAASFGAMPDLGLDDEQIDALVDYLLGG
jgi:mono/diheme cytochrome c family protein